MKAIVHIGMPKTGTTAIQNWLNLNAKDLLRQGVLYDRIYMPNVNQYISHVELHLAQMSQARRLVRNKQTRGNYNIETREDQKRVVEEFEERLQIVLEQNKTADRFVFSSEQVGIGTRKQTEARAMNRWIRKFFDDAHYVVYFRRQEDLIASNYVQALRRGQSKTFLEYCREKKQVDHGEVARHFMFAAGVRNVTVRLTEPDVLANGDVISDFADICGISMDGLQTPPKSNESLSAAAAEVLRHINERIPTFDGPTRNPLALRAARVLGELSDGGAKLVPPDSVQAEIRAQNEAANRRIRDLWFPERPELFPERPSKPALTTADPDEVAEVARKLRNRIGRTIEPYLDDLLKARSTS